MIVWRKREADDKSKKRVEVARHSHCDSVPCRAHTSAQRNLQDAPSLNGFTAGHAYSPGVATSSSALALARGVPTQANMSCRLPLQLELRRHAVHVNISNAHTAADVVRVWKRLLVLGLPSPGARSSMEPAPRKFRTARRPPRMARSVMPYVDINPTGISGPEGPSRSTERTVITSTSCTRRGLPSTSAGFPKPRLSR